MADTPSGPRRPGGPDRRGRPASRGGASGRRPRRDDPGAASGETRRGHGRGERQRSDGSSQHNRRPSGDERSERRPRRDEQTAPALVFPSIDPDVEPKQLDRIARRDLSALDKEDAQFVANHLVMSGRLVEDDPERAHEHAKAALHKGSRVAVVRETLGITAYLTGDFALALRELRTHRRLSGSESHLPMMVDCERGLGRPEKALELANTVNPDTLEVPVRVELAIARSGARLDLNQPDRALLELQIPELDPNVAYSYSPALFDAYAVVLEDLGRTDEAALWGKRASVAAEALAEATGQADDDVVYVELVGEEEDPGEDQ